MSDLHLFLIGCLVSLMVGAAVALLLWGASREEGSRHSRAERSTTPRPKPSSR